MRACVHASVLVRAWNVARVSLKYLCAPWNSAPSAEDLSMCVCDTNRRSRTKPCSLDPMAQAQSHCPAWHPVMQINLHIGIRMAAWTCLAALLHIRRMPCLKTMYPRDSKADFQVFHLLYTRCCTAMSTSASQGMTSASRTAPSNVPCMMKCSGSIACRIECTSTSCAMSSSEQQRTE